MTVARAGGFLLLAAALAVAAAVAVNEALRAAARLWRSRPAVAARAAAIRARGRRKARADAVFGPLMRAARQRRDDGRPLSGSEQDALEAMERAWTEGRQ